MGTPVLIRLGSAAADNATVFEILSNGDQYDTWQLGCSAGAMDVFAAGDGTNYLTAALALIDLGSTAPSTAVIETTAGGHYGIRGRWPKLIVRQKGATSVVGAYLIGYDS
jgi:hypothetical protein